MKKGILLKPLGRIPAGKEVETSEAKFAHLQSMGFFAKEVKAKKVKTKEEKHEQVETKAAEVNAVVDSVLGQVDKGETPKRRGRKTKG